MFLSEWREYPSAPCLARKKKTWWQLASRCCWNRARRLTCFRVCFLPGRSKGVSAPRGIKVIEIREKNFIMWFFSLFSALCLKIYQEFFKLALMSIQMTYVLCQPVSHRAVTTQTWIRFQTIVGFAVGKVNRYMFFLCDRSVFPGHYRSTSAP